MKTLTLITVLSLFSANILAERDNENTVPPIQLRNAQNCSDIQVENVVDWFKGFSDVNQLDQRIDPPHSQGDVGWCFSYTGTLFISKQAFLLKLG